VGRCARQRWGWETTTLWQYRRDSYGRRPGLPLPVRVVQQRGRASVVMRACGVVGNAVAMPVCPPGSLVSCENSTAACPRAGWSRWQRAGALLGNGFTSSGTKCVRTAGRCLSRGTALVRVLQKNQVGEGRHVVARPPRWQRQEEGRRNGSVRAAGGGA